MKFLPSGFLHEEPLSAQYKLHFIGEFIFFNPASAEDYHTLESRIWSMEG